MNQYQDEHEILIWADMFADYLAAFINPEGFQQFMQSETAVAGERLNAKYVNKDAQGKMEKARRGEKAELDFNPEILKRVQEVKERISKKVSEREEEFDLKKGTDG